MRNLLEAIAVNFLLRADAKRSYEDYLGVAFSLPFQTDTNTGMGILFKAYGDTVCHMTGGIDGVSRAGSKEGTVEEKQSIKETKEQVLTLLQDAFPNVKNVKAELERGFRFWSLVSFLSFWSFSVRETKCCIVSLVDDARRSISSTIAFWSSDFT